MGEAPVAAGDKMGAVKEVLSGDDILLNKTIELINKNKHIKKGR
jgi:hypothetical protein